MDFTYFMIPFFSGEERRLYRESRFVNNITKEGSSNSPIYSYEKDDFSCFSLQVSEEIVEDIKVQASSTIQKKEAVISGIWKLYFDEAY